MKLFKQHKKNRSLFSRQTLIVNCCRNTDKNKWLSIRYDGMNEENNKYKSLLRQNIQLLPYFNRS